MRLEFLISKKALFVKYITLIIVKAKVLIIGFFDILSIMNSTIFLGFINANVYSIIPYRMFKI